jgi:hypothetical protein
LHEWYERGASDERSPLTRMFTHTSAFVAEE